MIATMFTIEDRIKRVMVLTMLADGEIEDDEVETIRRQYHRMTGRELTEEQVRREAEYAREDGDDMASYIRALGRSLDDNDRRMIIRAAHAVASADGFVLESEEGALAELAGALDMTRDEVMASLDDTT